MMGLNFGPVFFFFVGVFFVCFFCVFFFFFFFFKWQAVAGLQMVFVDGIKTSGVVKLLLCIQVTRSICLVLVFFPDAEGQDACHRATREGSRAL